MDDLILNSIAASIIQYFRNGITAGNDVLFFIESTLGISTTDEIVRLMTESDLYGDGIMDLIFARNHELSMSIEPLVPLHGLSRQNLDYLTDIVIKAQNQANVLFDCMDISTSVDLSEPFVRRFIDRLNLSKTLPFKHEKAFPDCLDRDSFINLRVLIRNARYMSTPDRDECIVTMINNMVDMKEDISIIFLQQCLSFVLDLFNENETGSNVYSMLSAKKRSYKKILAAAEQFIEYYSRYSMEYLMSQKIHPPVADVDDIREKINLSDLICAALFGKPADSAPGELMMHYENKQ